MENEKINEIGQLQDLANELEALAKQKGDELSVAPMQRLIKYLRSGNKEYAKLYLQNQYDKFPEYRNDGIPVIIEKLFGGSGSPWAHLERKFKNE